MTAPTRPARPAREPVVGNAAAGIADLMASLGIVDTGTRDSVEDTVARELADRGLEARIRELRWGVLTLDAPPQAARLLRFDTDNLIAAVSAAHPGSVTSVRVRVAR